jgi:hypothetical protein
MAKMELQNLIIGPTGKTPQIDLNQSTGELIFSGRSIPENAAKFYEPAFNWVNKYIINPEPITNCKFNLEYYNTSSSLWIAKILKALIHINNPDCVLVIHIYIPLEDYLEIEGFGDLKDAFFPLTEILQGAIPKIGIRLYGTDEKGVIIKETLDYM